MKNFISAALTSTVMVLSAVAVAQRKVTLSVNVNQPERPVASTLHGVFFEEISHAGEGGLYAELIQNRGFEEASLPPGMTRQGKFIVPPQTPHFSLPDQKVSDWKMEWPVESDYPAWHAGTAGTARLQLALTDKEPLNKATPHSLQVTIAQADGQNPAQVINDGFWGIQVNSGATYQLHFYLRTSDYKGQVKAMLQRTDGAQLAMATITPAGKGWKKYSVVLKATRSDKKARFVLAFDQPGTVCIDFVSLFPTNTFRNRTNGLRPDLAQYIADLKPAFIRWPGGCFVEGITIQSAADWKKTIGPVEKRPGTYSPWGYWSSDGFGYHEYLQYCEDVGAAALYVFNAGVSCDFRSGTFAPNDSLQPYIQNALDAIEYAIGPVTSRWGKVRAAAGHPKPFPLKYVEIGNEQVGPRYAERYNLFFDTIKARYPQITTIASMGVGDVNDYTLKAMNKVELADEHAYKGAGWAMNHFDHFDKYQRKDWKMYVGEYATNGGVGAGNMEAALNDAVYIMGMEKNGDLVQMSSYAPLLVNTNDVDWPVNLINFNASESFARISYYAIQLFSHNRADLNLSASTRLSLPTEKKPAFTGGIGLATWDTKTAYKDIEIIQQGRTVFKSDWANALDQWNLLRGKWQVKDSALAQTAEGAQQLALLKQHSFDTYTLKLKARKLEGYNAFIIPFAIKDSNTFLRAHIGGWINKVSMFEKVTNGYDVSNISTPVNLAEPVEAGRWYDITLDVGTDTVKCYLDGKLVMTYTEPERFFAIAGKETKTGDLIIKVVNAYDAAMPVDLRIPGFNPASAVVTSLSAPDLANENSYETPTRFVPQVEQGLTITDGSTITTKPYSINIIRLKAKSGTNQPGQARKQVKAERVTKIR